MGKKVEGNEIKTEKGITLIALIITMIVILILSGITTDMITGEHGLINESITARKDAEIKNIEQKVNRSYQYLQEENDNAFEEAINELEEEGYKIKIVENEYYVLIGEQYYKLLIEDNNIKVDRNS